MLRTDAHRDDAVVVAFHTRGGVPHGYGREVDASADDAPPVGAARLCVIQRAQALALIASITREERSGQRMLDVASPGLIPVIVIGDDGVCVGVYDPKRSDGGWNEGALP